MTAKKAKATPSKKTKTTKIKAVAQAKAPKAVVATAGSRRNNMYVWHLRFGVLLILIAIAVVVLGNDKTVPLTTQYLAKDTLGSDAAGHDVFAAAIRHLWDVPASWLVAKFLVVTGAAYLLLATVWRKKYETWLERGVNPLRWLAFGAGGAAAVVTIAMLSGISDISTLMLAFGSVALAALLVSAIELVPRGRKLRRALGIGAILAVFFPFLIFVRTAGGAVMFGGALPMYLYFVYAVAALFAIAAGLAACLCIKQKGKWADIFYAERMVLLLGFGASVVLALQIFAGALKP